MQTVKGKENKPPKKGKKRKENKGKVNNFYYTCQF